MNDNQDISYTKPEDIAAKYGQNCDNETRKIVVKPIDCLRHGKNAVCGAYNATNDKERIVPLSESVTTVTIGGITIDGREGNNTVEQIANQIGMTTKSQPVKKYVKEVTDYMKSDSKHAGLRYNEGKLAYDLIDPFQIEALAKVYTMGAKKYGRFNWQRGQAYSTILASLKRHIAAFESGEDCDAESKCQHMAHAMWNCGALISFSKFYPQGDDRRAAWQRIPRIGLDCDEVLANFVKAYCKRYDMEIPHCWNFDPRMSERMAELKNDMDFWASIEPLIKAEDLPFEPAAYITSRPIPNEWTQEWLWHHKFPVAPVITVEHGADKLQKCEELGINWHVDDNFNTFRHLNANGMHCFLMDAKHNQRYDVGSKRIKSLIELKERW